MAREFESLTFRQPTKKKGVNVIVKTPDMDREVAVQIIFDTTNFTKEKLTKLRKAETLLREVGISFESGAGIDKGTVINRDWEWDWSLHGPVKVKFQNFVDEDPKNRYVREKENG